jgi:hypothetical protein
MRTGEMIFDPVVDFLVKEGFPSPEAGPGETRRGALNAACPCRTPGKL